MRRLALLLAIVAAPVSADPPTDRKIDAPPKAARDDAKDAEAEAGRLLLTYARCVADARPAYAERVLSLPFLSPEQQAVLKKPLEGEDYCIGYLPVELEVRGRGQIAAGMAEVVYMRHYGRIDAAAVAAGSAAIKPRNGVEDFALCLVRRNPSAARALLDTVPGPNETAAVQALIPDLGPCLPRDQTLSLTTRSVRMVAAAGLYLAAAGSGRSRADR
ncbi:MAG: hypothetical protein ACM3YM_07765 [Sphingomonadales bacterium]